MQGASLLSEFYRTVYRDDEDSLIHCSHILCNGGFAREDAEDVSVFWNIGEDVSVLATNYLQIWKGLNFEDGFMELALLDDFKAVIRDGVANIATKRPNGVFNLRRINIDIEITIWSGQDRDVIRRILTMKVG
jgi:hypothetical protein